VSAILITLIVLLGRFALRRRQRLGPAADEERSSVRSGSELLAALGNRLKRALGFLRPAADPLADLRADRRWAHTVAVREAYTALLRLGAERGIRRTPGRTTREHAAHLTAALPRNDVLTPAVVRLTGLYDAARYGASPATETEAAAAQDAWRAIERSLRQP